MNRDVVVVHPGTQHSADLAASLDQAGRLAFLATRLQIGSKPRWPWNSAALQARMPRRVTPRLPDARIQRIRALDELLLRASVRRLSTGHHRALDRVSTRRFVESVLSRLGSGVRVVIGTDTASLVLFERLAVERPEIARVLDVSHPLDSVVQPLIRDDADRWGLDLAAYDDYHPGPAMDQRLEIESADVVLVASRFSGSFLGDLALPADAIQRVPYAVAPSPMRRTRRDRDEPLSVLALGALSERKGMSLLLRAMGALEEQQAPVRLRIAGREAASYALPSPLPSNTAYVGAPSQAGVARLFAESDVLVLPSMCEGFGRTLLEALAAGLAVITTERSGGPDILEAAPSAPLTIIPADRRDKLAEVLSDHAVRRDHFIRPQDAMDAASQFSDSHYLDRLQVAISAGMCIADARMGKQ